MNDLVERVANSLFNDRLSRGIDWIVIGLLLLLLIEYEFVHLSKRDAKWKSSPRSWVYGVPLTIASLVIVVERLKNGR
ncbi:MAG TPA: hypothetical protein PLV41_02960 [Miltoncostaeales bacterium]|nr:hypothetical protein [Miltoncostaeales bacterium]